LAPLVQLTLAFLVMCLAPLTKPIGLLPLPFFFIAFWRQLPDLSARLRFLIFSTGGGLILVWLAFWPFGSPLPLIARLLREADTGGGFSITTLLLLLNQRLSFGFSADMITNLMRGLAGLGGLWLLWQTGNGRSPLRATAGIFALYLLQALNFRIWYSVWLIPWLILEIGDWQLEDREERHYPSPQNPSSTRHAPRPYYLQIALYFLLATQLSVLIYGHLRVYALDGNHFPAHLLGVPFVFGLPFLLALQIWPIGSEIPSNSPSPPAK
jgi:hypothetical protein